LCSLARRLWQQIEISKPQPNFSQQLKRRARRNGRWPKAWASLPRGSIASCSGVARVFRKTPRSARKARSATSVMTSVFANKRVRRVQALNRNQSQSRKLHALVPHARVHEHDVPALAKGFPSTIGQGCIRVLGMLGSTYDPEVLAAARKAEVHHERDGFCCWSWLKDQVPADFKPCECGWSGLPHLAQPRRIKP
jgi:hypothetical protein